MNVNELTTSLYGHRIDTTSFNTSAGKAVSKDTNVESTKSFESILSDIAVNNDTTALEDIDTTELASELINEFSGDSDDNKSTDVMSILTDAEKAKEYLSSKSGRTLIQMMAENSIASIVSETEE